MKDKLQDMKLTRQQIEGYDNDGFISGVRVITDEEAIRCRQQFDQLEAQEGRERSQTKLLDCHYEHQFIWDLATDPGILDCVEALHGPNILVLSTQFFCKYGASDKFVAWHQDLTYWGLEPFEEVTAWLAVDDSDGDNGCMRIIPGKHRGHIKEHGESERGGNLLSVNQEVKVGPEDETRAVDCVLKAGEMSLHHGLVIHGSAPNLSGRRRCGLTIRYIPTHVRPLAEGPIGIDLKWNPVLVRGEDREKNFATVEPPFPIKTR